VAGRRVALTDSAINRLRMEPTPAPRARLGREDLACRHIQGPKTVGRRDAVRFLDIASSRAPAAARGPGGEFSWINPSTYDGERRAAIHSWRQRIAAKVTARFLNSCAIPAPPTGHFLLHRCGTRASRDSSQYDYGSAVRHTIGHHRHQNCHSAARHTVRPHAAQPGPLRRGDPPTRPTTQSWDLELSSHRV